MGKKTFASLFSGGCLADCGAQAAGLRHIWGVEMNPKIATIAETNGFKTIVSKVEDVDYSQLEKPFWLHASPVCKNASTAKKDAGEAIEDIESANAIIRAIETLKPRRFSLENVRGYRKFQAFKNICSALRTNGYKFKFWHLHAADFGVPQSRIRLILVASLDSEPVKPIATHSKNGHRDLFHSTEKWRGWYEAIEDLIPTFPESKFADWQLKRLREIEGHQLIGGANTNKTIIDSKSRGADVPAFTIAANSLQSNRTLLVNESSSMEIRAAQEPCAAQVSSQRSLNQKIVLMQSQTHNHGQSHTIKTANEPVETLSATQNRRPFRASLNGRVVKLTPRALARFQTVPDWYQLPEHNGLACEIIGNGVPTLLMQKIVEANIQSNY